MERLEDWLTLLLRIQEV